MATLSGHAARAELRYRDDPAAARRLLSSARKRAQPAGQAYLDHSSGDEGAAATEAETTLRAVWFELASVLMNLDEMITKG